MDGQENLKEVIRSSWFVSTNEKYVYTSVKEIRHPEKHLILINDGQEITIVTNEENLPLLGECESNKERWRLLNVRCGNPFYCVGFIAYITAALAKNGIDIVITSSFSNDLVLVMEKDFQSSVQLLTQIGFEHKMKCP